MIQPIEEPENLLVVSRVDAVVSHKTDHLAIGALHSDFHTRFGLTTHELNGVVDQVLIDFEQPYPIDVHHGHRCNNFNHHAAFFDPSGDELYGFVGQLGERDSG